jgi:hypothetical protein
MVRDLMEPEYAQLGAAPAPTGLEGLAGVLEQALAAGGFYIVGAAIPAYVAAMDDFWSRARPATAPRTPPAERPTSPRILQRRARLALVRVPRLTIRAPGRVLDGQLIGEVVARFRQAVAEAYRTGEGIASSQLEPAP